MMTQHSLSTSHQIAGEKIVDFLNQFMKNKIKFKELTESTRKKLENVLHTNIILAVEEINWLDIIEVLKLLHSEEVRRVDPILEYYCLVAEEELLQELYTQESLVLQLAKKKLAVLYVIDHVLFKTKCLTQCLNETSVQPENKNDITIENTIKE